MAGHDRGGRVAYRMALDHPERVQRARGSRHRADRRGVGAGRRRLALGYWHWGFLAQPSPLPERLIAGDADAYFDYHLLMIGLGTDPEAYPDEVMAAYRRQLTTSAP